MKFRNFLLLVCFALCSSVNAMDGVKSPSHCAPNEKVIFSCPFKNGKTVSLCASPDLSKDTGTLQYRYGMVGAKPELEFPNEAQQLKAKTEHPIHFFNFFYTHPAQGKIVSLSFKNDSFNYEISILEPISFYVLAAIEYQAPADRGAKRIRSGYLCLKNKTVDNLVDLKKVFLQYK